MNVSSTQTNSRSSKSAITRRKPATTRRKSATTQIKSTTTQIKSATTRSNTKKAQVDKIDSDLQLRIQVAAYYKAQARGFMPGHELEDWLTAEKEEIQ